jgi:hypothetical protein
MLADLKKRVNEKQNVEIDSAASSGNRTKYVKYVSFAWTPIEVAMSVLDILFFCLKQFFCKELIKTKATTINAES